MLASSLASVVASRMLSATEGIVMSDDFKGWNDFWKNVDLAVNTSRAVDEQARTDAASSMPLYRPSTGDPRADRVFQDRYDRVYQETKEDQQRARGADAAPSSIRTEVDYRVASGDNQQGVSTNDPDYWVLPPEWGDADRQVISGRAVVVVTACVSLVMLFQGSGWLMLLVWGLVALAFLTNKLRW